MPEYREIPLTQGQVALVDAADYDALAQHKWCALWDSDTRSYRAARGTRIDGANRTIYMHREILGLKHGDPQRGDHVEASKTLDNRRLNLRIATHAENTRNQRKHRDNRSGYKGVTFKSVNRYQARIRVNGKCISLGYRKTAEAAYRELYLPGARLHHGEFMRAG
jgi:hypothetical protein